MSVEYNIITSKRVSMLNIKLYKVNENNFDSIDLL